MNFSYPPKFEHRNEPACWQHPWEFALLITTLSHFGVEKILEIGVGHRHHHKQLKIWGFDLYGIDDKIEGHIPNMYRGDSKSIEAVEWARRNGPYDAVFIDGDHTIEGVASDWYYYSTMADIIVIHDIGSNQSPPFPTDKGVSQWWEQVKKLYNTIELHAKEPENYGVGIITK